MRCPASLFDQRVFRCLGEVQRGCGIWPFFGTLGLPLEPPFERFDWQNITRWDLCKYGFSHPYQGMFIDKVKRLFFRVPAPPEHLYGDGHECEGFPCVTSIAQYADDEVTYQKAEQLLLALGSATDPITFELFGIGPGRIGGEDGRIEVRFAASDIDLPLLESQLHSLYPRAAVASYECGSGGPDAAWLDLHYGEGTAHGSLHAAPLYLTQPYCFPLRTYSNFTTDPLGPALAVMEELQANEWALVQVMFQRAKHPWPDNLKLACHDPYRPNDMTVPELDRGLLADKLSSPFYAVSIILSANHRRVLNRLGALVRQYESPHNQLAVRDREAWSNQWRDNEPPGIDTWRVAVHSREPVTPGVLLNAAELVGFVHLPNPEFPGARLQRVKSQTRAAPKPVTNAAAVVIGRNTHRGQSRPVSISPELRARHCYIAGASGTGKSTLLLQMILQDIASGQGVGLLDPHGDLVKAVLRHIPENRINDVVLFDASDTEYPFGLNILDAHDEAERERIVAETIMALERYFPASWGPRLERILQYTIRTVLHAVPGATLSDVERMLTDEDYRETVLSATSDPRMLQFWKTQFPFLPKNATDPVLNKLSVFLLDRNVRNITCQRRAALNFDDLLNNGKILLANLSTGLLTEKIAGTLGSFLVTKIVNAAFRRASMPEGKRRPWYLYVDEFQSFMNLSVGFERILAESRKYKLVLAGLANQFVGQLSSDVRQAIFGNVGTMIVFRLGIEDASTMAKELGVFTADDILNLELGQAIARAGGSSGAFNLQTNPPFAVPVNHPTDRIVALNRQRYARPRREVEQELSHVVQAAERLEEARARSGPEPSDPFEDDLVK